MNIIMHFPKTIEASNELKRKIAVIHAESVVKKVNSFGFSKNKSNLLIDEIIRITERNIPPVNSS